MQASKQPKQALLRTAPRLAGLTSSTCCLFILPVFLIDRMRVEALDSSFVFARSIRSSWAVRTQPHALWRLFDKCNSAIRRMLNYAQPRNSIAAHCLSGQCRAGIYTLAGAIGDMSKSACFAEFHHMPRSRRCSQRRTICMMQTPDHFSVYCQY